MVEDMWEKYREERERNENKPAKHGKQTNQKLKPYVVLEYLLKYSDENNTKSAYDIIGYLEDCGISAERRSIYRDIEDIKRIMLMLQEDIDLDEADRMFAEAEESGDEEALNELKTVLNDETKRVFMCGSGSLRFPICGFWRNAFMLPNSLRGDRPSAL